MPFLPGKTLALTLISLLLTGLCLGASPAPAAEDATPFDLQAFPPAQAGMTRFVIDLPEKGSGEEQAFQVELVAGRELFTDGVNLVRLSNAFEPRLLEGWGYTYYELTGSGLVASTLMAPPEGVPMVKSFVTGEPLLVRYNSRLPIVVYTPAGYQLRYRIWSAPAVFGTAGQR